MNDKPLIKTCPTCGSDQIQWVVRDVTRSYKGQAYTVPAMEFYECPNCGEKVYDKASIQKIEAYSPAYRHEHTFAEA